jgi:hypothetical protein
VRHAAPKPDRIYTLNVSNGAATFVTTLTDSVSGAPVLLQGSELNGTAGTKERLPGAGRGNKAAKPQAACVLKVVDHLLSKVLVFADQDVNVIRHDGAGKAGVVVEPDDLGKELYCAQGVS